MFCPNCNKEIDDDSKFCPSCGAEIKAEVEEPEVAEECVAEEVNEPANEVIEAEVMQAEAPKKGAKGFGIAALICGIISMILAITCCGALLAIPTAIAGIVLSAIAIKKADVKTMGIIALILSIAGLVLAIIDITLLTAYIANADNSAWNDTFTQFGDLIDEYDF